MRTFWRLAFDLVWRLAFVRISSGRFVDPCRALALTCAPTLTHPDAVGCGITVHRAAHADYGRPRCAHQEQRRARPRRVGQEHPGDARKERKLASIRIGNQYELPVGRGMDQQRGSELRLRCDHHSDGTGQHSSGLGSTPMPIWLPRPGIPITEAVRPNPAYRAGDPRPLVLGSPVCGVRPGPAA